MILKGFANNIHRTKLKFLSHFPYISLKILFRQKAVCYLNDGKPKTANEQKTIAHYNNGVRKNVCGNL